MSAARVEALAQDVLAFPDREHAADVNVVLDELLEFLDDLVAFHLLRGAVVHGDVGPVQLQQYTIIVIILVWPTSWTPAVGGIFVCELRVCESVRPRTCRHIARRMTNG